MFSKLFKVKSNSQLKGSERRRIRSEILSNFPQLCDDDLNDLIPNKEVMVMMKVYTHAGVSVVVYCVQRMPVVFEVEGVMYPTVYMLWHLPLLLPAFTTWPHVYSKLVGGADLMLPGVVLQNGIHLKAYGKLKKGDRLAVNLTCNKAPVAVGKAALSSDDMYMSAGRGKAVLILHYVGDQLWAYGTKSSIPELGPPEGFASMEGQEEDLGKVKDLLSPNVKKEPSVGQKSTVSSAKWFDDAFDVSGATHIGGVMDIGSAGDFNSVVQNLAEIVIDDASMPILPIEGNPCEAMDILLHYCFLKSWKTTAKKVDIPLLTSNFYKLHMIPACPAEKSIDIKKSSFKKLSKFLTEMEKMGIIKLKELTKGVESITAVDLGHLKLQEFVDTEPRINPAMMQEVKPGAAKPEIVEMYSVTAAVLPVVSEFCSKKGDNLTMASVRKYLTEYIKKEKLQDPNNKKMVTLNPILSDIVQGPSDLVSLSWEELMVKFLGRMSRSYQMSFSGDRQPVVAKGKLEPIDIQVGKRTGNKKVTLINNLELYGLNLQEFSRECQHGVAASTSITSIPGKKSAQLMVQGNQVVFVSKLLMGKYNIPKHYIRGLENATKLKK